MVCMLETRGHSVFTWNVKGKGEETVFVQGIAHFPSIRNLLRVYSVQDCAEP